MVFVYLKKKLAPERGAVCLIFFIKKTITFPYNVGLTVSRDYSDLDLSIDLYLVGFWTLCILEQLGPAESSCVHCQRP
jgi:hypothetical protein